MHSDKGSINQVVVYKNYIQPGFEAREDVPGLEANSIQESAEANDEEDAVVPGGEIGVLSLLPRCPALILFELRPLSRNLSFALVSTPSARPMIPSSGIGLAGGDCSDGAPFFSGSSGEPLRS